MKQELNRCEPRRKEGNRIGNNRVNTDSSWISYIFGRKKVRILAGFLFCMVFIAGWGTTPVDLKITDPMIDLDVMIEDAKIGHTDKASDTGEAQDEKILGEDDDPETRITKEIEQEPEEEQEEPKESGTVEGNIEDYKVDVTIRIRHTDIFINETKCTIRTFDSEMEKLQKQAGYLINTELVDDYAEYRTYVNVRKALDAMLIRYEETEL